MLGIPFSGGGHKWRQVPSTVAAKSRRLEEMRRWCKCVTCSTQTCLKFFQHGWNMFLKKQRCLGSSPIVGSRPGVFAKEIGFSRATTACTATSVTFRVPLGQKSSYSSPWHRLGQRHQNHQKIQNIQYWYIYIYIISRLIRKYYK